MCRNYNSKLNTDTRFIKCAHLFNYRSCFDENSPSSCHDHPSVCFVPKRADWYIWSSTLYNKYKVRSLTDQSIDRPITRSRDVSGTYVYVRTYVRARIRIRLTVTCGYVRLRAIAPNYVRSLPEFEYLFKSSGGRYLQSCRLITRQNVSPLCQTLVQVFS